MFSWFLLANLVRTSQVTAAAATLLEGMPMYQDNAVLSALYTCTMDYWGAEHTPINHALLLGGADELLRTKGATDHMHRLQEAINYVFGVPAEQLNTNWSMTYMANVRKDNIGDALRQRILTGASSREDMEDMIRTAATDLDRASPAQPVLYDDMAELDLAKSMVVTTKEPIGIPFVDQAMGGGQARAESALWLIPSGGGKTTLALQAGVAGALAGQKVTIFFLEQPIEGDLTLRLIVLASGGSRRDWQPYMDACKEANLQGKPSPDIARFVSPHLLDRYRKTCISLQRRLVLIDYASGGNPLTSMAQIFAKVREHDLLTGVPTDLLIVDWLGVLRDAVLEVRGTHNDNRNRTIWRNELKTIAHHCKAMNTRSIFFHQLTGLASKKLTPVSTKDAQEDSNLDNYFSHAFAVSGRNGRGQAWVNHEKGRSSATGVFRWWVDGEHCLIRIPTADQSGGPVRMAAPTVGGSMVGDNFRM